MVRLRDILERLDAMTAELRAIAQAVEHQTEREEARASARAINNQARAANARGKSPQERHRHVQ